MAAVERHEVEAALRAAHERFVEMVRGLPAHAASTPCPTVPGWDVADVVAHVLTVLRRALGDRRRSERPDETAALNQACLDELPERDLGALARLLEQDGPAALDAMGALAADRTFRFHGGLRTTIVPVSCVVLSEYLVHGFDIAHATQADWQIPEPQASLVLRGSRELVHQGWLDDPVAAPPGLDGGGADALLQVFGRVPPQTEAMRRYLESLRPF